MLQITLNFGPDFQFPPTDEDFQPVMQFRSLSILRNEFYHVCAFKIYMLFLANESGFAIYVKKKIVGRKGKKNEIASSAR